MTNGADRAPAGKGPIVGASVAVAGAAGIVAAGRDVGARVEWIVPERRGGGVPVDVDEALQGLYQVARTVSDAVSKRSPQSPASDGAASGIGGYAFSAVVGIPVAFFSALAIRGGWAEFADARERGAMLRTQLAQSRAARQAAYRRMVNVDPAPPSAIREEYAVHDQVCDDLKAERARNRSAAGIGFSACASGLTMLLRTVADAALQIGLAIAAKSFNVASVLASSPLAAALSAGMATVGTIALGPLAGVLAITLGAFYLHQSRIRYRRLDKDRTLVREALERQPGAIDTVRRYREYVLRKVDKRHRFLRRFRNWNAAFLTGGLLFGGAAAIKAGIGVAALIGLGAGVLAGPVGILVLLAIGTLGALLLGASSVPFITQGGKNKRHQLQYAGDHPEVDRHRLAPLDILLAQADGASEGAPVSGGLLLRSQMYSSIEQRKKALTGLLAAAARGPGHSVGARNHPDSVDPGQHLGTLDRKAWGFARSGSRQRWRACRAFLRALAVGHGFRQARRRATAAYRNASPEARLAGWLKTPDGLSAQRAFMQACLASQGDYLSAKLQTLKRARDASADLDVSSRAANAAPALPQQFDEALSADERTLEAIEALAACANRMDESTADALTERFLALQAPGTDLGEGGARHAFARFCLEDLSAQLAETAGVLVATELHAARVGDRMKAPISY
ncbi:hypothetical protein L602_002300000730 [Cupriavidus gilardii J11]|uniref:Uncharacterized protein n=1 Tax=Cupriavidus gilardii J11 TaxID=936133 RepID=A0A562BLM1_9BURK|nr:hypothetical protein [Cupriavidus gilardii]TWG85793.1 hypothetical protein L602_002300000730 [Cupriavidus gilardii J11]